MNLTKLEICERTGISARQFDRRRAAGLIPPPYTQHLGHGRGTATTYPEFVLESVRISQEPLMQGLTFAEQLLRFWVLGDYGINPLRVRDTMARIIAESLVVIKTSRKQTRGDSLDWAEGQAEVVMPRLQALVAKGIRIQDLNSTITALLLHTIGAPPDYRCTPGEPSLSDLLTRVLNLDSLPDWQHIIGPQLKNPNRPNSSYYSPRTPADDTLAETPSLQTLYEAVVDASEQEMAIARRALSAFQKLCALLVVVAGPDYQRGFDYFGFLSKPPTEALIGMVALIIHSTRKAGSKQTEAFYDALERIPALVTGILDTVKVACTEPGSDDKPVDIPVF